MAGRSPLAYAFRSFLCADREGTRAPRRGSGKFPQLETAVPLGKIPSLDQLISLPEQAASAQIRSYADLYPLQKQYREATSRIAAMPEGNVKHFRILSYADELPPYQQLDEIVRKGEATYPAFQE